MGLFLPPIAAGVTSAKWGAFDMGVSPVLRKPPQVSSLVALSLSISALRSPSDSARLGGTFIWHPQTQRAV